MRVLWCIQSRLSALGECGAACTSCPHHPHALVSESSVNPSLATLPPLSPRADRFPQTRSRSACCTYLVKHTRSHHRPARPRNVQRFPTQLRARSLPSTRARPRPHHVLRLVHPGWHGRGPEGRRSAGVRNEWRAHSPGSRLSHQSRRSWSRGGAERQVAGQGAGFFTWRGRRNRMLRRCKTAVVGLTLRFCGSSPPALYTPLKYTVGIGGSFAVHMGWRVSGTTISGSLGVSPSAQNCCARMAGAQESSKCLASCCLRLSFDARLALMLRAL